MIIAKQFLAPVSAGTGVTISQGETKGQKFWRIGINAEAQKHLFNRQLDPAKDAFVFSVDPTASVRHILHISLTTVGDANGMSVERSMKGSVACKLTPWTDTSSGKRPAEGLSVIFSKPGTSAKLKLPEWARPPIPKPHAGKSIMED